jgi:GT2 family glycosyltransferase
MDVIILVHDVPAWADLCIRAVEAHTKNSVRIIVVDNASVLPETKAMLKEVSKRGHTVIHLNENKSFSNGVNVGVNAGSSKFICVLNDDAIVTDGWDGQLIQDASQKEVGLVGARSNFASGAQMDPSFIGEPPFLVFVCVAMRREVWEKVGPMDEINFDGFSSEDLDYSWRVVKHGFKLKVSNAFVLHAGSRTLAATTGDALARQRNDQKYNQRLVEKWGREWIVDHSRLQSRGLVATYSAEEFTRIDFLRSLMGLRRTDGVGFSYYHHTRSPIHLARQLVADYALDNGFDWLVQIDDDATFPDDLLRRLLSHQKDVVCALAYQRRPPYLACAYDTEKDGIMGAALEGIEHTGLRKVDVSGFHCSIIRTSVFKRLREGTKDADGKVLVPGTRAYYGGFENKVGEDFAFCLNLRKLGIPVHVDTELIAGHIGSAMVIDEAYKKAHKEGRAP